VWRVVEAEVLDLGVLDGVGEVLLRPVKVCVPDAVREEQGRGIERPRAPRDDRAHLGGQGDVARLAMLAPRDRQHAGLEVDVLPPETEELRLP
jgi:hypothetical protein